MEPLRKEWTPHIWEGIDFFAWVKLLARNRFAVNWRYAYVAAIVTGMSAVHSILRLLQHICYGKRIARTTVREAPIFIIGHWRSGTTLLHEYLSLDPRHSYPTTYECLEPNHFLLTERFVRRWLSFLAPSTRPMDNMAAGFERPQEDEFALCMMGVPSPYLTIAFPNAPPAFPEYFELENLPPGELAAWKNAFLTFIRRLTYKDSRRLVLKSPAHTCRIPVLLAMFPEARFIHIVRNPYVVYPSTIHMWKSLYTTQGLQKPSFSGLEEQVFSTFNRLYDGLEKGRGLIPASRFYELRYEDLVDDPIAQMRKLYEHLGLGGLDNLLPHLQTYLAGMAGYETNTYEISAELRAQIRWHCGRVIDQYGYRDNG